MVTGTVHDREQDNYIRQVEAAGIHLTEEEDPLTWIGKIKQNHISVSEIYKHISYSIPVPATHWLHKIWKWEIRLRLICFGWLALHNKILILTWGISLAEASTALEYVLFVYRARKRCHIYLSTVLLPQKFVNLKSVLHYFQIKGNWTHLSSEEFFKLWFTTQQEYYSLPFQGYLEMQKQKGF